MYVFKKGKIQKCNLNYRVLFIYLVFALQTTSHLTHNNKTDKYLI